MDVMNVVCFVSTEQSDVESPYLSLQSIQTEQTSHLPHLQGELWLLSLISVSWGSFLLGQYVQENRRIEQNKGWKVPLVQP